MNNIKHCRHIIILITLLSLTAYGSDSSDSIIIITPPSDRYLAFESDASNLVAGDSNAARDIFVRNTRTGVTTRVSVDSAGTEANGDSYNPAL